MNQVIVREEANQVIVRDDVVQVLVQPTVIEVRTVSEQGVAGPPGEQGIPGPPGGSGYVSATNEDVVDLARGVMVYVTSAGNVKRTQATVGVKAVAFGLTVAPVLQNASGYFQAEGLYSLPTAEWDSLTGMVGGLVPGAQYFLSVVAGAITPFAPSNQGEYLTSIGIAVNSTDLWLEIERPIRL